MTDQPRPILGFLWPRHDVPVDDAARQDRLIRVPGRGWLRVLTLIGATLGLVIVTATALMAAIGIAWLILVPAAAVLATFWVLLLRAWTLGTYVNDRGIAVQRLWGTQAATWASVARVEDADDRVVLHLHDGRVIATLVARRGLDLLGSTEGYDIAKVALQNWASAR